MTARFGLLVLVVVILACAGSVPAQAATSSDPDFTASVLATSLSGPANGLIFRPATNDLLVTEFLASRVTRIDPITGVASPFASVSFPDEMAMDAAGNVFVKSHPRGPISRFDSNGNLLGSFPAATGGFPTGLAFDSAGNLYQASDNGNIYKFSAGNFTSPTLFAGGFFGIEGIAFNSADQLFVAGFGSASVYQATPGCTQLSCQTVWATGIPSPLGIAVDPISNDLFVSEFTVGGSVVRIHLPGGPVESVATGFSHPMGVAFDSTGSLYVNEFDAGQIWKFKRANAAVPRPLIYVLGIGGSELKALSSQTRTFTNDSGGSTTVSYSAGDIVWINGAWIFVGPIQNFEVLRFNGSAPLYGDFAAAGTPVDFLGQGYPGVIDFFKKQGYVPGQNFFIYAYDWRFDASASAAALDQLVGRVAGGGQVDIMTHSMGGQVARQFLLTGQNASKVHRAVFLAPPNLGTPKGAFAAMAGVDLTRFFIGIPANVEKFIFATLPGGLDQAPSSSYYSVYNNQDAQHPVPYADLTTSPNQRSYSDLRAAELSSGVSSTAIAAAEAFHSSDLTWPQTLSGTNISLFAGAGHCTIGQIQLKDHNPFPFGPRLTYYDFGEVDGDGTVTIGSSSMNGGSAGGGNLPVYYRFGDHAQMGLDAAILTDALHVVQGSDTVSRGNPNTAPNCKSVSIHSPMEMLVTDPSGNRVGGLGADDRLMEAPESDFWRFGDMKVATLETPGPFTVNLRGTATGETMIKVRTWGGAGLADETVFTHVPTTANTTAKFTFDNTSVSTLQVDVNGDGTQVLTIAPTLLTGSALNDVTPPAISIDSPGEGQSVVGSFPVAWTATDTGSGVARSQAVVDKGAGQTLLTQPGIVSTLSAGPHTLDVWAEDRVENTNTAHRDFTADSYSWQPPLRTGFQANIGQAIPVKFSVATAAGTFVADASVLVDLLDSAGKVVTGPVGYSQSPAQGVTIQDGKYHVDLSTDGLAPGTYTVRVRFNSPTLVGTLSLPISLG